MPVMTYAKKTSHPIVTYYPTKDDIINYVYRAKKPFELSKFDQHNLKLKLKGFEG